MELPIVMSSCTCLTVSDAARKSRTQLTRSFMRSSFGCPGATTSSAPQPFTHGSMQLLLVSTLHRTRMVLPTAVHCIALSPELLPLKSLPSTTSHRTLTRSGPVRPASCACDRGRNAEPAPSGYCCVASTRRADSTVW